MSIDQDIANSAKQLEADVRINYAITHGDDTTEVPTEGGPVPSIRKRLKDIEGEWSKTADPLADNLATVVQTTRGYQEEAAASAGAAVKELAKVQAEGIKQVKAVADQGILTVEQVRAEGTKQVSACSNYADAASGNAYEARKDSIAAMHSQQAASNSELNANLFKTGAEQAQASAEAAATQSTSALDQIGGTVLALSTSLIRTQTIITEYHAFR